MGDGSMASTNFHLAPPAKTVDGLNAVPIDIQSITGTLVFDSATSGAQADVTIDFIAGPSDGNPVFDVRQTIDEAWLDGAALPVAQLAHHDFGGGANANLRIIEAPVLAGSVHTLRLRYTLGLPQASAAGSYQPNIAWNAGPRLIFNFGFTDLGAGRYLEAWLPANLTFDQFSLALDVSVTNTGVDHSVITNATVTALGTNHWQLQWPATITTLSPLLEIRATDTLEHASDVAALPVSGTNVTINAWKLTGGAANLATQLTNIAGFLTDNENDVGAYVHGARFVAFFNVGGMEYDGGTTTDTSALRHETFHSWWGRGIKPALPRDGWWDEAWTVYKVAGGMGSVPLDFTDPPVLLSMLNPWSRITPSASYTSGRDFFDGLAAMIGTAALNQRMDELYAEHSGSLITTETLEEWLLQRSGNDAVVDAFHRFVYGFDDPATPPDIWLKDDPAHLGDDLWGGTFWDSPDLWVRTQDDGGTDHQNPEHGQDNWLYARIRNRSATQAVEHFVVTFNVKSFAGTQFSCPGDFLPCIAAVAGFNLAPGETRVVKQRWPSDAVPPGGTHACLLASLICRGEHPVTGAHVWEHNNLAQKNLTIVDLEAGDWLVLPLVLTNVQRRRWPWFRLMVARPRDLADLQVDLLHTAGKSLWRWTWNPAKLLAPKGARAGKADTELLDCAGPTHVRGNYAPWTSKNPQSILAERLRDATLLQVPAGRVRDVPVTVPFGSVLRIGARIHVPKDAKRGSRFKVHIVQRTPFLRRVLGGVAVEVRVR
jgi:hypothetical protein